jgi:hypothetical protein
MFKDAIRPMMFVISHPYYVMVKKREADEIFRCDAVFYYYINDGRKK